MTTAPENYGTDSMSQVGPSGGLQSGVIAGVTGKTTSIDPIQAEIDRINAARKTNKAVLDDTQYPTKTILTNDGRKVQVYTGGPLSGKEKKADGTTGDFVTGTEVDQTTGGGSNVNNATPKAKLISTYTDPETGDIVDVYDDGTETVRKKGTIKADAAIASAATAAERLAGRTSAYDILFREFKANGLESLVSDAKNIILNEDSDAGRLLALRNSPSYVKRFGANEKRKQNGFAAIDEATYLGLEDKYQQIAQNYGLPSKYYARGELGVQQYFADAIAKNIDPVTFEERIMEGQKVLNANKLVLDAAKKFYPDLNDGDFLDYILNPENALSDIKRKVSAAEIGGAQLAAGLQATKMGAEDLVKAGVTGAEYQGKASAIAGGALRGSQLANIYGQDPYTQQSAEQVALNIPGSVEAQKQTKKIIGLEKSSFGGKPGLGVGALTRDRAGAT